MAGKRKTARWVGVVLLLLVSVWGLYRLFDGLVTLGPEPAAAQFLLPALSFALVVLVLALAGILIRNLVRLIVERKRGILGSRLRTKLVFFFLALVLVPALILFAGSAQIIKQTVEAVLRTPMEDLTRQSREMVDQWNEYFRSQSLRRAESIAAEIVASGLLATEDRPALVELIRRRGLQDELALIWVTQGDRPVAEAWSIDGEPRDSSADELRLLMNRAVQEVLRSGRPATRIDYLEDGLLAQAALLLGDAPTAAGGPARVLAVAIRVPAQLALRVEGIDAAERSYRRFRAQRRELVHFYLTLIGLIFLVTLFVASWIGFYMSRRITVPLQQLAAAAREISAGNLGVRVRAEVGDEMGMLVEAFNEMAGELQENREVITRSTADLRRSNRALDERRRYIETLLANLSTAVISLDPEGLVTTANPAVQKILGREPAVGEDARRFLRERGLEPLAELLDREPGGHGAEVRSDLSLDLPRGTVEVAVHVSPLVGSAAENLGTLVMLEDLTELLRAQKAAAWREIARRIAHEIKNPLTPIQLAAQRLRKKFAEGAGDLQDVVADSTASIEREVGALKRLVDEFSKFARMPEVAPREVSLGQVVESALALYRGLPDVRWDVSVPDDMRTVRLDPEQMRRVLINLIDNALAAMGGRGTIRILARVKGADGPLRIEVADDGPGIAPADRDKMFSPYFSTKRRGTGLGLAIVHRVVTDHRGTITVEDDAGGGARFVIDMPA